MCLFAAQILAVLAVTMGLAYRVSVGSHVHVGVTSQVRHVRPGSTTVKMWTVMHCCLVSGFGCLVSSQLVTVSHVTF